VILPYLQVIYTYIAPQAATAAAVTLYVTG